MSTTTGMELGLRPEDLTGGELWRPSAWVEEARAQRRDGSQFCSGGLARGAWWRAGGGDDHRGAEEVNGGKLR